MKTAFIATLLVLLAAVVGCTQYQYGNATYSSADEAVRTARADVNAVLATVKPAAPRLGGRALLVVPTRAVILANGVNAGSLVSGEDKKYIVDVLEISFLGVTEAVRKAEVFDDTVLMRSDDPESALFDTYDYKLWLLLSRSNQTGWYLSRKGMANHDPVAKDTGLTEINSFVRGVVDSGERLGAMPIDAVTP